MPDCWGICSCMSAQEQLKYSNPFLFYCIVSFLFVSLLHVLTLIYTALFFLLNSSCSLILILCCIVFIRFLSLKWRGKTHGELSKLIQGLWHRGFAQHNTLPSTFLLEYLRISSLCCGIFFFFFLILHVCRIIDAWMHPYVFWQSYSSMIQEKLGSKLWSHLVIQAWPECGCIRN